MNMNDESGSAVSRYVKEWNKSRDWIKRYTNDFGELETLVDAVSLHNSPKAPLVGDITLAAAVRQIPRQSVQQLPTMSAEVNGTKRSIKAIVSSWVLRRIVFNQDSFGTGVLSKVQLAAESAFTHGFQVTMSSFGTNPYDLGVNMQLVHHKDFAIETGVMDFSDSGFFDVRTRVVKSRASQILERAKKNRKDTTWNIKALEELINSGPDGSNTNYSNDSSELRTQEAMDSGLDTYEWVTRYGVGPYYKICVFDLATGKELRKTKTNSKFGYPRVQGLVIDPAQLTPFGISRVRLASAPANYANIYQQSTAKMLLLNSDPPTFERGEFVGTPALRRGVRIKSLDPNAEFKLMELSNSTLNQFQTVLTHIDNQILNVMGITSGSVGGGNTDSNYSKTTAGVQMEQSIRDLTANQITMILENYLRQHGLTAMDLWISEQARIDKEEKVIIDDEAKDAINELGESKHVITPALDGEGLPIIGPTGAPMDSKPYEPLVGDDNILMINWKDFYDGAVQMDPETQQPVLDEKGQPVRQGGVDVWTVDIDMSMGKEQMDEKKRADLQDIHTVISQTANPNDPNDMAMKSSLTKELLQTALPDTAAIASNKTQSLQQSSGIPQQPQGETPVGGPQ